MQEDVVLPEPCHFGVIGGHTKDLIKESTVLFKRVQNGGASSAFCPSSDFSFHCCVFVQVCLGSPAADSAPHTQALIPGLSAPGLSVTS